MSQSFIQRSVAFCLSAVLTLAMLGGIDHLAVQPDAAAGWAQQNTQPAPRA
jgi:hypothetical protein